MDISIIVPCYNTGKYIEKLLNSLYEQDVGEYEVEYIFVLNNCTDNTEQILKKHKLNSKILFCEEQGCGLARNVGIDNSFGKYIWFMDSDDWLMSKDAIKTVLDKMNELDCKMLRIPFESDFTGHFSMVWQYCFRRDLIGSLRFRKTQPAEDNVFTNECLNKLGLCWNEYKQLPHVERQLYYYNYMREGSNMYRYTRGEDINA